MKIKLLLFAFIGSLIALAAWQTQPANRVRADEVPEKYRDVIRKGLDFLAAQQHRDGHWEGEQGKHPVANTALAGMAFLMNISENADGPDRSKAVQPDKGERGQSLRCIARAVDWLIATAETRRGGLIFSGHPSELDQYMYGHGLATQFLAWACFSDAVDSQKRERISEILKRAAKYTANVQSSRGGWYRTSKAEGHDFDEVLSTSMQIEAVMIMSRVGLRSNVGLTEGAFLQAIQYGVERLNSFEKEVNSPADPGRTMEIAAILGNRWRFYGHDDAAKKWFGYFDGECSAGKIRFGRDEMAHYCFARGLFPCSAYYKIEAPAGKDAWVTYRDALFEQLKDKQDMDGSWPAAKGVFPGSISATAMWCFVLQLDRDCHPVFGRMEDVPKPRR